MMNNIGMCKYCQSVNADMTEEPCKSCNFTRGNFKLDLADRDKQVRDEVIEKFISKSDIEISESVIWNMIVSGRNKDASDLSDELVDYFSEVIRLVAEQMKGE